MMRPLCLWKQVSAHACVHNITTCKEGLGYHSIDYKTFHNTHKVTGLTDFLLVNYVCCKHSSWELITLQIKTPAWYLLNGPNLYVCLSIYCAYIPMCDHKDFVIMAKEDTCEVVNHGWGWWCAFSVIVHVCTCVQNQTLQPNYFAVHMFSVRSYMYRWLSAMRCQAS